MRILISRLFHSVITVGKKEFFKKLVFILKEGIRLLTGADPEILKRGGGGWGLGGGALYVGHHWLADEENFRFQMA